MAALEASEAKTKDYEEAQSRLVAEKALIVAALEASEAKTKDYEDTVTALANKEVNCANGTDAAFIHDELEHMRSQCEEKDNLIDSLRGHMVAVSTFSKHLNLENDFANVLEMEDVAIETLKDQLAAALNDFRRVKEAYDVLVARISRQSNEIVADVFR